MNDIWFTGVAVHVTVSLVGKFECLVYQLLVPGFITPVQVVSQQVKLRFDTFDIICGEYVNLFFSHQPFSATEIQRY
jgi:hypothetical protein